jgi:GcrA cell cycle regulator
MVPWSDEQKAQLITLWNSGAPIREIAEKTGMKERAVCWMRPQCGLAKRSSKEKWEAGAHDLLLALWAQGHSAAACAQKINEECGTTFTKNAVIGRVDRSFLPRRRVRVAQRKERPARVPRVAAEKRAPVLPRVEIIDTQIPFEQRKQLLTLGKNECRWPVNHVGDADFFFCGGKTDEDCSYCPAHYARSVARHVPTGKGFNFVRARYA